MAGCMNGGGGMIDGIADPRTQPQEPEEVEVREHASLPAIMAMLNTPF